MNSEAIEIQIWEYMDGTCSEADKARIAALIAGEVIWRMKFDEISAFHSDISASIEQQQPSLRFTKNVMDSIATMQVAPATNKYINKTIIRGIAAFFILTIGAILVYAFAYTDYSSPTFYLPKLGPGWVSDMLNSNWFSVVMGINIILALALADTLLRKRNTSNMH